MVVVPTEAGVNVTRQLATVWETVQRVQVVELKEPMFGKAENVTVPVGVIAVPPSLSVTVAVQVAAFPTPVGDGVQEMVVASLRRIDWPSKGMSWVYAVPLYS